MKVIITMFIILQTFKISRWRNIGVPVMTQMERYKRVIVMCMQITRRPAVRLSVLQTTCSRIENIARNNPYSYSLRRNTICAKY